MIQVSKQAFDDFISENSLVGDPVDAPVGVTIIVYGHDSSIVNALDTARAYSGEDIDGSMSYFIEA